MSAQYAHPGMTVTLVLLTTRPALNGTTAVLQRYMRKRQMWKVLLPDGAVFAVRAENMRTREMLAQLHYRKHGRPMLGEPSFAELVRVVDHGEHGRGLVATRHIPSGTCARDLKVQLVLTPAELRELDSEFDAFQQAALPRMMGFPGKVVIQHSHQLPRYSSRISSFVGRFLLDGHTETALMQDLMDYDHHADKYLKETLERLVMFDVLYFDFWRTRLHPRFSADAVWRAHTFLLSHGFLHDDCVLSLGLFCKAQCDERRWAWYEQEVRTGCAPPLDCTLGNIEDVAPWGVQTPLRSGEIPGDQCVIFTEDVPSGAPVTMDYGPSYMINHESQLRQYSDHEMRPVLDAVLGHLDPRVMRALERHMQT